MYPNTTGYSYLELRVLATTFLALSFSLVQRRYAQQRFFALWAWAWTAYSCFLLLGSLALRLGHARGFARDPILLLAVLAGFVQSPLLVLGARRFVGLGEESRKLEIRITVGALMAGGAVFGLSLLIPAQGWRDIWLCVTSRQYVASIAFFYCAIVFGRWPRKVRSSAARVVTVGCLLHACALLINAIDGTYHLLFAGFSSHAGSPVHSPFAIPWWSLIGLTNEPWRALGMIQGFTAELLVALGMTFLVLDRQAQFEQRSKEAVRLADERCAKAFRAIPDGISITSLSEGRYLECNDNFLRWSGHTREEVIGRTTVELGIWTERSEREKFVRRLRKQGSVANLEARFRVKGGGLRTASISAEIIHVQAEACILCIIRDVTEGKSLEAQLRQSQKMETLGILAGGIAHDFNNVLTGILGYAELLMAKLGSSDPRCGMAKYVVQGALQARSMTHRLLAFSRKQAHNLQTVSLNPVVADTERMLRRVIGENIELVFRPDAEAGYARVDPEQIGQVLLNLAVNARDAMPEGGRITMETHCVVFGEAKKGHSTMIPPGKYVVLTVADTGCGMDAETQARIFEPFFTTKGRKGTGLGLSIVYSIVRQFGAYINVRSQVGCGSAFEIYFPAVGRSSRKRIEDFRPILLNFPASETILLVEDSQYAREATCAALEVAGYWVLSAANAREALEIAQRYLGTIHLLLTDVILPEMSGPELMQKMKDLRADTKVLYVTGYPSDAFGRHKETLTKGPVLLKPYTNDDLWEKVRQVLDVG